MKKIIGLSLVLTALFSCGHGHHMGRHDGCKGKLQMECGCKEGKPCLKDGVKKDETKADCENCKK